MDKLSIITLAAARIQAKSTAEKVAAEAVTEYVDSGITLKGSVEYYKDLPTSGNEIGDEYIIKYAGTSGTAESGQKYIWDGDEWIPAGYNLRLYRDEDGDLCEED